MSRRDNPWTTLSVRKVYGDRWIELWEERCLDPRRRASARSPGAGPRSRRESLRDGVPAPAESGLAGDAVPNQIRAAGKNVVVIGGGDTGSDCVGTNRQGAKSVTQFELLPQRPARENKDLTWQYWPVKLRTSSSQRKA